MTFQSLQLADQRAFVDGEINTTISHSVNVNKGEGISTVYLDISITPVGVGALTLYKLAPFGIIASLLVRDQNNKQLFLLNSHELVFLSTILTTRPPFETVLYNDGTNGWVPVTSATDAITAEEIRGTLNLPIRLPVGHNVSKLTFEIKLASVNAGADGWVGVGLFGTSSTSITGRFTPHIEYDNGINHSFLIIKVADVIGTDFAKLGDLPENSRLRYAVIYLEDYWEAELGTTDDEWLIDEVEYQSQLGIKPVVVNRFSARHIMHDLLDLDPDFVLGDTTSLNFNMIVLPFPDVVMGANAEFRMKNDTTQDASMVLVLVENLTASPKEVVKFSPASINRLLSG